MNKYLMSITKFSEFAGVDQSTLRYYDDIGLLIPDERRENRYRYYAPQQIITVNFIRAMKYMEIPLKSIKELAQNRSPKQLADLLMEQSIKMNGELRRISELYSLINTYHSLILEALAADENKITVQHLPALPIIFGSVNECENEDQFYKSFVEFCKKASRNKINIAYPIGGYFDDMETFAKKSNFPKRFFSLDTSGTDFRPEGEYLVGYTRGSFGVVNDLPERLISYAKEHQLTFTGPVYTIHPLNQVSQSSFNDYMVQVSVPVSKESENFG